LPDSISRLGNKWLELALIGTVNIDDKENVILLFLFAKLVYYFVYIEEFQIGK